ncbi:MAG: glycosyltransferase, partial [Caldilineaceae bacterium]|nr:glycosyltransferase [Caldilineaceae bacterium]
MNAPSRLWRIVRTGDIGQIMRRLRRLAAEPSYARRLASQRLTDDDRRAIQAEIARLGHPPLISVLLPVYNSNPAWLRACLDSVLAQLYPHWELCVADDASTLGEVRAIVQDYADREPRIKVVFRPVNGHVAATTNSALTLATGDYVAFLDHDDLLTEDALYRVATLLDSHRDADMIYSDEDRIDARGRPLHSVLKPGWSPDLLRAHNYINHLTVIRSELVRKAGGLREGFEGAQDHDLLLRVSETTTAARIHHIPHVHYHWRKHGAALGNDPATRAAVAAASRRSVAEAIVRQGLAADVLPTSAMPFLHRVRYRLPDPPPLVSVIIPTRDRLDLLRAAVDGVRVRTDYSAIELIVVDNDSREPETLAYLCQLANEEGVRVLRQPGAFNYAALNNAAAALATAEVLCFLNNDIVVTQPGWLTELVSQAMRPEIGAAGPLLRYPDGRVQSAGIVLGSGILGRLALHQRKGDQPPSPFQLQQIRNVAALTGACLVMRRAPFAEVGGFDTELAVA